MSQSEDEFVEPQIRISKHAYESLLTEMSKRKLESLSALLERLGADLEISRKVGKQC